MKKIKTFVEKYFKKKFKNRLKGYYKILKNFKYFFANRLIINNEKIENVKKFSCRGYHVFNGYYDYYPISRDKAKLLCQRVKINAETKKNDTEIGYYNINSPKKFIKLTQSKAWCWQQGSRLHWSNLNNDYIYYNDIDENEYCTKVFDFKKNKVIDIIKPALYDISPDEKIGITTNFSRLQRLRNGYGYDRLKDTTEGISAPKNDGLWFVNIKEKHKKLLISFYELSKSVKSETYSEHYINHISFSPNGKKVMFFHIWTVKEWPGWKTRLCIYNLENQKIDVAEEKNIVSHYDWIDNDKLIMTVSERESKTSFYRIYDVAGNKYQDINRKYLNEDGHPTIDNNQEFFISDTYPNKYFRQKVFMYDLINNKKDELVDIFSDPRENGEFRCDLHPKYNSNGSIVIDTTYKKSKRSIMCFYLK